MWLAWIRKYSKPFIKSMFRYLTNRASRRGWESTGSTWRNSRRRIAHSGVNTSVGQAEDAAVGYRVAGIPSIAVAGKYTVSGDHKTILAVSDELIVKVRAEEKKARK
jgi:hypothetical protein